VAESAGLRCRPASQETLMEETRKHALAMGFFLAVLAHIGSAKLPTQDSVHSDWQLIHIPDGETVYDALT
jgi:hypothetical protein